MANIKLMFLIGCDQRKSWLKDVTNRAGLRKSQPGNCLYPYTIRSAKTSLE